MLTRKKKIPMKDSEAAGLCFSPNWGLKLLQDVNQFLVNYILYLARPKTSSFPLRNCPRRRSMKTPKFHTNLIPAGPPPRSVVEAGGQGLAV